MTQEQAKQSLINVLKQQPAIAGINIDIQDVANNMLIIAIKELKEEYSFDNVCSDIKHNLNQIEALEMEDITDLETIRKYMYHTIDRINYYLKIHDNHSSMI